MTAIEELTGLHLGFHDYSSSPTLPIERREHRSPSCLRNKAKDSTVCRDHCGSAGAVDQEVIRRPEGWVHTCPWGLSKIDLPFLDEDGQLSGTVFAVAKEHTHFTEEQLNHRRQALLPLLSMFEKEMKQRAQPFSENHDRITDTHEFIKINLELPVRAEDLASHLNLSPSRTRSWLKSTFKKSFSALMVDARLKRAEQMLIGTSWSVAQISERLQFYDPSQFSRAFKTKKGSPPLKFRQKFLQGV